MSFLPLHSKSSGGGRNFTFFVETTRCISNEMIEDGAHVVFDWDNTLKLYDKYTHQLSCRVSREFLLHLKQNRQCRLYIISAIRPSAINLGTILSEMDKLNLTDVFVENGDHHSSVVKSEYAHKGNVIICGYDKAETFLLLSGFDSSRGDHLIVFDDEEVNIYNFKTMIPSSRCFYICQ